MKRKIVLSIALVASLMVLSLIRSDSVVTAQNQLKPVADSGMVPLGPNQVLILTVNAGTGEGPVAVRFRQMEYDQVACSDGVCKHLVANETVSPLVVLQPNEAASQTLVATTYGRGVVLSNKPNVRVNGIVFDTSTQRVVSIIYGALTKNE